MNIYRKRQIAAAVLLLILIFLIVSIVKCTAGLLSTGTSSDEEMPEMSDEFTVPNADIPENIKFTESPKNEMIEYIPSDSVQFETAELIPDDISLVNERYINDVVIIGDSISKGYSVYGRLRDDNVLAVGSIGIRNVLETDFEYQGYNLRITDIIERKKPKYIFVSLGMNDINLRTEEEFKSDYQNFISELQEASSESYIIITAVTPISKQTNYTQNSKIDQYNEVLRKMVYDYRSDKIFFVNAAKYLKGEDNYLVSDFSSGDGIHLAADAYDYLLTYMFSMLDWI